jgi:hypothetical protein
MRDLHRSAQRQTIQWAAISVAAFAVLILAGSARAAGTTLYVANNGTDDVTCGLEGMAPCRSISRAIAHASAGDQIVVGPGLYGDINRDASVDATGDSGEENRVTVPPVECPLVGVSTNWALIHVDKRLTIVSRDGAGATVIDAGGQFFENYIGVNIAADGVVFGKRGKGFTIRNGAIAVNVNGGIADASVQGNVAECHMGFVAGACDGAGPMAAGTVLKANTAASDSIAGFQVFDDTAVISGNLAKANLYSGFILFGGAGVVLRKNIAVDGLYRGYILYDPSPGVVFSKNAAIGNMDAGVFLISPGTAAIAMSIGDNALFGNGKRPQYPPANCGLVIQNAGAQPLTVDAEGNWWGAASGPGADPADAAGGTCNAGAVTLNLAEWATKEIRVKPPTK